MSRHTDQFVDWRAVGWVVNERIRMPLNKAERLEVVRRLTDRMHANELGELLGVTGRQIERDKAELRAQGHELVIAS